MCFPLSFPPGWKVAPVYIFYSFFPSMGLPLEKETATQGHTLVASTDRPLSACHSHALKWRKEGQTGRAPLGYYTNITNVWKCRESVELWGRAGCTNVLRRSRDRSRQTTHMTVYVCVSAFVCHLPCFNQTRHNENCIVKGKHLSNTQTRATIHCKHIEVCRVTLKCLTNKETHEGMGDR